MSAPRIYHPGIVEESGKAELTEDYLRYITQVLRLKEGDRVVLFDGRGYEYETRIDSLGPDHVILDIVTREAVPLPEREITLAQSLPKGTKMDFIIQKSTELGVNRIIPFTSARSIPRIKEGKSDAKVLRWRRIAVEASRQCRRTTVPEVTEVRSYSDMLVSPAPGTRVIIFWEGERERGIREILRYDASETAMDFFLIVGPEGGFSDEEVLKAKNRGFITASLGRQILRTETAPLAILSVIRYEQGEFSPPAEEEA